MARRSKRIHDRLNALPDDISPNNAISGLSENRRRLLIQWGGKASRYQTSSTKRRKILTSQDDIRIDRLSGLPDDILHHILGFLDTKSSVQTAILSRRWTSVWKYVHVLTFYLNSFSSKQSFEQHANGVLSFRSHSSSVSRIEANFKPRYLMLMDLLDTIPKYAASHGVRELKVCLHHTSFVDAFGLIHGCYQSLKVLELQYADFVGAYHELCSCLQVLESLTLTGCYIDLRDDAFLNLPRLESLKLFGCVTINGSRDVMKVTAPKLLNLEINSRTIHHFEIVAPKLQSFVLKIYCFCVIPDMSSKSNLPSLHHADIKLGSKDYITNNDCSSDIDAERLVNLFKILHNVQILNLEVDTFKLLIKICNTGNYRSCSPFRRMKSLNLKCPKKPSKRVLNQVARYFLGGSANKEKSFKLSSSGLIRLSGAWKLDRIQTYTFVRRRGFCEIVKACFGGIAKGRARIFLMADLRVGWFEFLWLAIQVKEKL
ncbi:F-box/LRR-repeat protein At3g03360 [Linum grandiflorum]